ncbi:hypothetical protein D3C71_1877850 [compost metagenome]
MLQVAAIPLVGILVELHRRLPIHHIVPEQAEQRVERCISVVFPLCSPLIERQLSETVATLALQQAEEGLQRQVILVLVDQVEFLP